MIAQAVVWYGRSVRLENEAIQTMQRPIRVFVLRALFLFVTLGMLLAISGCFLATSVLTASFRWSPQPCFPGQVITFDALASSGGRGGIATYHWSFHDGTTATGPVVTRDYATSGSYTVRLTITDSRGSTAMISRAVDVFDALLVPAEYTRIQDAIDAARDGDRIVVMPGTYVESIRVDKDIILQSSDPGRSNIVESTIIRGFEYGLATVRIGSGSHAMIEGFTILTGPSLTGGAECGACYGVVYIREASPTIRGNRIINSTDSGIAIYESKAHIEGNTFSNNSSTIPGGAISVDSYTVAPVITRNTFEGNTAPSGGAIFITATAAIELEPAGAAETIVSSNVFTSNTATEFGGGAIFVEYVGNLRLDSPDSNIYEGNYPNTVQYIVPPTP